MIVYQFYEATDDFSELLTLDEVISYLEDMYPFCRWFLTEEAYARYLMNEDRTLLNKYYKALNDTLNDFIERGIIVEVIEEDEWYEW